tara:strand:- start:247 stop:891 length:645 start_codon:yes stop_codon:yes gene_type:complete
MFEIRESYDVRVDHVYDSPIYIIDDFYQDPDSIVRYLMSQDAPLWKMEEEFQPSHNGIYFEDRKHQIESSEIAPAYYFLQSICKQKIDCLGDIDTNVTRFKKHEFNDYQYHYWSPHTDDGYTAIVYLNKDDTESGTNLYESLDPENEPVDEYSEHYYPWRPKDKYRLLKTIEPKYNRMVMYDGHRFLHGANICNDRYFGEEYRLNQVYFFEQTY